MIHQRTHNANVSRWGLRRGFTLIEAAMVTVIVGIGVVAMMQLLAAGSLANGESTELTTAIGLANNIHEMSLSVDYASVMTLDNKSYTPPVNSQGTSITNLPNWKQTVTVNYVDHNNIKLVVPKTQVEPTALITVSVSHNNRTLYTSDWLTSVSTWP